VFDHALSLAEKREYLKAHADSLPFGSRLLVENTPYRVLGKGVFDPPEPPEGDDNTEYIAWNEALLARFIEGKDKPFVSLKQGKLTISKLAVDGDVVTRVREKKGKKFEPVVCGTGDNRVSVMEVFAKFIDSRKKGLPMVTLPGGKSKRLQGDGLCVYIELLAREEHKCDWITPEELSVLYDGKAGKGQPATNQDRFTAAFRK
jgi:hypothetical protein